MKHGWRSLTALSVLALAACSQKAENDAGNALDNAQNAVENTAESAGNLIDNASLALTPTPSPQEFVDKAAKGDAFQIAAAELAPSRASSAGVKDFAQMMITAHKESTAAVKKAATAATPPLTPDAALTADQKGEVEKLKALKGADFDKAYIDGQVEVHENSLALMKKYAADGGVESLKAVASTLAPVVEQHLTRARELDKE